MASDSTQPPPDAKASTAAVKRRWLTPDTAPHYLVALFTLLLAVFAGWAWRESVSGTKALEGQLAELKQSFAAERAYVLSAAFKPSGDDLGGSFAFKNYGRTPADIRVGRAGRCVYSTAGFPTIEPKMNLPGTTDASGQIPEGAQIIESGQLLPSLPLKLEATAEQIQQARNGNGKLYCRALVVYEDMRGNTHQTVACVVHAFGAGGWLPCPETGANLHD